MKHILTLLLLVGVVLSQPRDLGGIDPSPVPVKLDSSKIAQKLHKDEPSDLGPISCEKGMFYYDNKTGRLYKIVPDSLFGTTASLDKDSPDSSEMVNKYSVIKRSAAVVQETVFVDKKKYKELQPILKQAEIK